MSKAYQPGFIVEVHSANQLKVWRESEQALTLSADRLGIIQTIRLYNLTPDQRVAIIAAFGRHDQQRGE